MPKFNDPIPLSLYIHIPWCVRKCPYCDFNSHEAKGDLPESLYVAALMDELSQHLPHLTKRPLTSIFFGGGTPSLFTGQAIGNILAGVEKQLAFAPHIEITLEANPGTLDEARFKDFRAAGVNRLSIGVQSLEDSKLQALGRIHGREQALQAITMAKKVGFDHYNIDLMYGLPDQTLDQALSDLNTALAFQPPHLSWYQLTIEPNTFFHHQPPLLPAEDALFEIQEAGIDCLQTAGLIQYEVSAYAAQARQCQHNRNYWEFGDYLGLGAGAHSKLTDFSTQSIVRYAQTKNPRDYLDATKRRALIAQPITESDALFEFMLNGLRLSDGISLRLFTERTGLPTETIQPLIDKGIAQGLLTPHDTMLLPSSLGKRYLNDLVGLFLP